jgi:hypothetical protein
MNSLESIKQCIHGIIDNANKIENVKLLNALKINACIYVSYNTYMK